MNDTCTTQGRSEITNPHLDERQVNPPCLLCQILCPIGKNQFHYHIGRENVKGILERHLVAGRNDEVVERSTFVCTAAFVCTRIAPYCLAQIVSPFII